MSTLYFHIPFCKKACHYCDFHFSTVYKTYGAVIQSMLRELELRQHYLADKKLTSIYFGGGTPSLLKEADLNAILQKANTLFDVAPNAEITLEANPDDLTVAKLNALKSAGINRLSIGVQSFYDMHLTAMNRSHEASQAVRCINDAQEAGFANITIDLIFGLPNLSLTQWETNINQALKLNVPHISAYSLTVEPKTALHNMVAAKTIAVPPDKTVLAQYNRLTHMLNANGFHHYELSNYGQPGFYSQHNSSYWAGHHYLGIGPSAHSFNGNSRHWNVANNTTYCKHVAQGEGWFEQENLSVKDRYNEYIMTGLRTAKGVSISSIEEQFTQSKPLLKQAAPYLASGQLVLNQNVLKIPEREWMMSDHIISDLFWTA